MFLFLLVFLSLPLSLGASPDHISRAEAARPSDAGDSLKSISALPVDTSGLLTTDAVAPLVASSLPSVNDSTDSLLIRFVPGTSQTHRTKALGDAGLVEVRTIPQLDIVVATRAGDSPGASARLLLENALRVLKSRPDVLWAEPSNPLEPQVQPNDPVYPHQWGPAAVGLPAAWNTSTGSAAVVIAVIDSGLGYVSDFWGRVVAPYSILYGSASQWAWTDIVGHGTACAGIAAAAGNDGVGMAGAAWKVKIMPIHVSDQEAASTANVAAAFIYAADKGADIISISLGSHQGSQTLSAAINYALSRGVVVVAAAGNDGAGSGIDYPAAYPGVVAVGATTIGGSRASFSSTGSQLDLAAPGEAVASYVYEGNGYWSFDYLNGTSFSTPLVAGVAALMLSHNSSLTADRVSNILAATADDLGPSGWDSYYGDGLLDADEAVASAGDYSAPTLSFSQPVNGSKVRGQVQFVLAATDNIGVYKVEQYLDGVIQFTTMARTPHYYDSGVSGPLYTQDLSQPIIGVLDSTHYADGTTHTVTAKAYDAAGNVKTASVTFTVDNSPVTTTTVPPTTTTTLPPTTTTTTSSTTSTTTPGSPQSPQFPDVVQDHPYTVQISDLAGRGIIGGFEDGTFRPEAPVTRQQFAKMIVKTLNLPVSEEDICPFTDVMTNMNSTDPLYPDHYVAVCAAHGITVGKTPVNFAPYASITRAQLITMVTRSISLPDPPQDWLPPFAIFDTTHYPFARRAAYAGLLNGLQGVGPDYAFLEPATRGEVCALLYNVLHR